MNRKKYRFFKAVRTEDYEYLENYLKQGLSINIRNNWGYKAIHLAIFNDLPRMADFLIEKGAVIDNQCCCYVAAIGSLKILKILIEHGEDINVRDICERTALHWAAQEGHIQVVRFLIDNNALIDIRDDADHTPLYIAAGEGHYDVVKVLLENNATVDLTGPNMTTPFKIACAFEYYDIAKLLLENGADVNAVNYEGRTALFHAKVRGDSELEQFLLMNGADENIRDNFGVSIKDLNNPIVKEKIYKELFKNYK